MTIYQFGASWQYSDDWAWRVVYSFTQQPIPSDQMTVNILAPGGNELNFFDPSMTVAP